MVPTAQYVEFDVSEPPIGFEEKRIVHAYGFKEQELEPREIRLRFKGQVGYTEGYGKRFEDLFREGSLTLGEEAALFNVYLLARRGLVNSQNPREHISTTNLTGLVMEISYTP